MLAFRLRPVGARAVKAIALAAAATMLGAFGAGAQPAAVAPPAQPAAIGCDAACLRRHSDKASQACAPRIEAQSTTDFDWLTRPYGGLFQEAETPEPGKTIARYRGDSIRFLSPEGAWQRVSYECGFDVESQTIAHVAVRPGRLGMAAGASQIARAAPPVSRQPTQNAAPGQGAAASDPPRPPRAEPRRIVQVGEPSPVAIRQVDPNRRLAP